MKGALEIIAACGLLLGGITACSGGTGSPETPPQGVLRVFVSVLPQAYLVERIGGAWVDVEVLLLPGESPATYEPTPRQMAALATAQLYFCVGVPFENALMPGIESSMRHVEVVDTRRGVPLRTMGVHRHGGDGHEGRADPHIWLGPPQIKVQAQNIAEALARADPSHAEAYSANLAAFLGDLSGVDVRITALLEPYAGRSFYVFHPAFGYFGNAYGLEQVAAEVEGKSPGPKQLQGLIERARADNVRIIFVQPQFDPSAAQAVARAIGGVAVSMDPMAKDILVNIEAMAAAIAEALAR